KAVKDDDGTWWWELDEHYDFENHVTIVSLDNPDDPHELQALVASHRTEMLDRDKPLWQAIWVDRYLGGSAMILRTHHAVADGMRMVELSMSLFDASPYGGSIMAPEVRQVGAQPQPPGQSLDERVRAGAAKLSRQVGESAKEVSSYVAETMSAPVARAGQVAGQVRANTAEVLGKVPAAVGTAGGIARTAVTNPVRAGHSAITAAWAGASDAADSARSMVRTTMPGSGPLIDLFSAMPGDVDTVRKLLIGTRNDHTIWTGTAGSEKGVAWSEPLPLADVKDVAKANRCTVNDVLVTCAAGSLNEYLQTKGARCSYATFMVPVNLKPLDTSLPDELGNGFALVQLELPLDEPDPLRVLAVAKSRMNRIKQGHESAIAFRVQQTIAGLNRSLYEASVDLFTSRTLGTLTNVPGPPIPVYMAGKRVEGIVGWAPVSGNQPMSFTIYSYDNKVIVGIACDKDLVPDHEMIPDAFGAAFERLRTATAAPKG
ncbi:MAG TPA: WS/DGAT domain-containing protein, partial [Acidimicrobiales bacterium]